MPNYIRHRLRGGTFFFTLKTENNAPLFRDGGNVARLGRLFRETQDRWPFEMHAVVLLPDHLHALWSLPLGDGDFSVRWAWLKKEFSKEYVAAGGVEQSTSESRRRNRRFGVWQRRFWEHTIRDDKDFERHFDYIHWNPVKHGCSVRPADWPHSSFHRWADKGCYPNDWGVNRPPDSIAGLEVVGE